MAGASDLVVLEIITAAGAKMEGHRSKGIQHPLVVKLSAPGAGVFSPASSSRDSGLPTCYGYGVTRRIASGSIPKEKPEHAVAGLFDDQSELRSAEEWLLQIDHAASKPSTVQKRQRELSKQVQELLVALLPDVTDIRITTPTKERPRPGVEFHTEDGWIPLQWIGHGYRTLVAWMVDLASRLVDRYPDSADPLAEPAIVLVDEIDLHLHPRWQRTMMSYLSERFPNTQFIVTAHSPLFVQAAADANLVVLRRDQEKGHVVIDNSPEAIKGWRVDQIYTSDLFGIESARSDEMQRLLDARKKLATKPKLTGTDRKKLAELEEKIGYLPTGETASDAKTMQLLEETLKALKAKQPERKR